MSERKAKIEALVKASNHDEVVAWMCSNCGSIYKFKKIAEECSKKPDCIDQTCDECGWYVHTDYKWYCNCCKNKPFITPSFPKLGE